MGLTMKIPIAAAAFLVAGLAHAITLEERARATFKPLPSNFDSKANPINPDKVALGRMLYFENRVSKNHDLSCNSCHNLENFGVDNEPTSLGHKKQRGGRNSPTVYNAGNHIAQFWDGRAATLEDQAKGPVLNPVEMAMKDAGSVEATLKSMPEYVAMFKKAFPSDKEPVTYDNFARAIGAFERTLVTPGRFDAYLKGDAKALTDAEKKGLDAFMTQGCIACHTGEGLGGHLYQKLGLVAAVPNVKDMGRFDVTKNEGDRLFFRVPSLRNVAKTAPYMHDGSIKTLEEAVAFMGKYQLGQTLNPEQVSSIVAFLNALTGELPNKASISKPTLPKSTKTTPKPDPS